MTTEGIEADVRRQSSRPFRVDDPTAAAAAGRRLRLLLQARSRIISVSSTGHDRSPGLDWNDLQRLEEFHDGRRVHQRQAREHPVHARARQTTGRRRHRRARHASRRRRHQFRAATPTRRCSATWQSLKDSVDYSPEEAADTLVWLAVASEPGQTTGGYYHQRKIVPTSAPAQDDAAADRLWIESEALIARHQRLIRSRRISSQLSGNPLRPNFSIPAHIQQ